MLAPPRHLTSVLTDAVRRFARDGQQVTVRLETGGPLSLPSGSVVAMEPYDAGPDVDEYAFTCAVRPGSYPVTLVIAAFPASVSSPPADPVHELVAAAVLVIEDKPVVSWEMALCPGQDLAQLGEHGYFGYSVDGGIGCFTDALTLASLSGDAELLEELDSVRMDVLDLPTSPNFLVDADDRCILVAFATGDGDGACPTWIGRTAGGAVACFATEFSVLAGTTPLGLEPSRAAQKGQRPAPDGPGKRPGTGS